MEIIRKVYNRQKYMYENDTPKDRDRIVSFKEWYIRLVIRDKASKPMKMEPGFIWAMMKLALPK